MEKLKMFRGTSKNPEELKRALEKLGCSISSIPNGMWEDENMLFFSCGGLRFISVNDCLLKSLDYEICVPAEILGNKLVLVEWNEQNAYDVYRWLRVRVSYDIFEFPFRENCYYFANKGVLGSLPKDETLLQKIDYEIIKIPNKIENDK